MNFGDTYRQIQDEIQKIRPDKKIQIICVSKTQPEEAVKQAVAEGIRIFGENRVVEGIQKFSDWKDGLDLELHHIGPLQSGTVRKILGFYQFTHGVASESALQTLMLEAEKKKKKIRYFLEFNVFPEGNKTGFDREKGIRILQNLNEWQNEYCILEGLMAMGPAENDESMAEKVFSELRMIRDEAAPGKKLSMGMSGDYLAAVRQDADYIRIGSRIFGHRRYAH